MAHVLGPRFKLSSLNVRSADPYSDWVQPLHIDGGGLPDENGYYVCNSIWILDDFTVDNGATRLIPGSHRWNQKPSEVLADLTAPHPQEILITGSAGTVVVMNSHLWHGGTANRTGKVTPGDPCLLHPQRQTATALSEEVSRPGVAGKLVTAIA